MITSYKIFEGRRKPKVGDYVICRNEYQNNSEESIGKIKYRDNTRIPYQVWFKNTENYFWYAEDDILHFSKNKEELEIYLDTKKYNL